MKTVDTITVAELLEMAENMYGNFVKTVVYLELNIMIVDTEMPADEEEYLLESGSKQANLWGINLSPKKFDRDDFVELDSMINIRPRQQNMSRDVEDEAIRQQIIKLVEQKVTS